MEHERRSFIGALQGFILGVVVCSYFMTNQLSVPNNERGKSRDQLDFSSVDSLVNSLKYHFGDTLVEKISLKSVYQVNTDVSVQEYSDASNSLSIVSDENGNIISLRYFPDDVLVKEGIERLTPDGLSVKQTSSGIVVEV